MNIEQPTWMAALAALSVCLGTLPIWLLIGRQGVRRWVGQHVLQSLHKTDLIWWGVAATASLTASFVSPFIAAPLMFASCTGLFVSLLVALARIDFACRLLPDSLTWLLIAMGLAIHGIFGLIDLKDALIGAVAGYCFLWGLARLFERLRNIEAMGRGDFAMAAGLGAWLGWQSLPMALMLASLTAIFATLLQRALTPKQQPNPSDTDKAAGFLQMEVPFGPALAVGAIAAWIQIG